MLSLSLPVDIYLCVPATDMRRSFDGLIRMAEDHLRQDPLCGGLFVFINKRRDRVKLLYFDTDGPAIWYKRLEEGTFQLPAVDDDTQNVTLSSAELAMLLGGIDLRGVRHRKRYRPVA